MSSTSFRDDTGLPWGFVDEADDPTRIREGMWIVVGPGTARAVAQVADIDGGIVRVRPLLGDDVACQTWMSPI